VIIDDPAIDFLIGPLTRSGTSPWPFFDETEMKNADLLGPVIPPSPGTSLLAGTVTVSFLSATVVGIGTQFLSDFACNGTDNIMIHYPVPGGGGATGMRAFIVQACADNVTMTISPAFNERGVVDASNVAYAKITNNDMAPWINGSNNYNYYDTVLAFYRLYYRTGLEVYRTYARTLADNWWRYPLDEGRFCAPDTRFHCSPIRVQAVMGMMMRALDGRPEMWPGIVSLINDDWDNTVGPKLGVVAENDWDFREFGYVYWFMATLAKVHPEPSMRETALQKTRDGYSQFWKIRQRDDGSWRMILDSSQGYEGAGTLPWQMAFPMKGLIALHRQTNDPEIAVTLQKAVGFVSNYGYHSPCRGLLYSVLYTQCAGGPCGTCTFQNGSTGGCTGAENCDYPPRLQMGSRTLANAIPEAYGYVYAITGNTTYLTMGDNLFSANYGGSGGGPGADGGSGNFVDLIIYGVGASGKEYGFTAGAGNAQSYLAYRQRSSASATGRSVPVSFSLIGVTNVSSVRIRVTRPSGWQSDVVCSSSPCSVAVDPRQGNHLLRKEYLSAVGKVLAAEEPVLLRVR
jgi:hypothetical protein